MSGPVEEQTVDGADLGMSTIEVKEGRTAQVGDMQVVRVLPTKQKRAVGPWCFVDLMRPDDIEEPPPLEIGPHPHIGLATVTWLFAGSALHSDSLGSEQLISPGQLNLMTSGQGLAHAELGVEPATAKDTGGVMGVQPLGEPIKMWWNFVARDQDEITEAWRDWRDHNDERFGPVPSSLARIDAPTPPWIRE
ncbi:MAG: pirin family protein [Acidimicrobiia bacterium]